MGVFFYAKLCLEYCVLQVDLLLKYEMQTGS